MPLDGLAGVEPRLVTLLDGIASCCAAIATTTLRTHSSAETGTVNDCGDAQIAVDVAADALVRATLHATGCVEVSSSEECTADADGGGTGYSVAYDPLDGSSIVGAAWAVGAIFGIWPGRGLVGRPGRDQAAAAYAVFGSRTLLVVARPVRGAAGPHAVDEHELQPDGTTWVRVRAGVRLDGPSSPPSPTARFFAPANLRAAAPGPGGAPPNAPYRALVDAHLAARATLRYTGGLVPDVHHILAKGGGAFINPAAAGAPPKLRLLYEVAPLALIVTAAGGAASDGAGDALDQVADSPDARTVVAFGDAGVVAAAGPALRHGGFAGGQRGVAGREVAGGVGQPAAVAAV